MMRRLLVIALLLIAATASAGESTAVVSGVVFVREGTPVSQMHLVLDGREVTTDAQRRFRFIVTPGQHEISVREGDFVRFEIAAGQTAYFVLNINTCPGCEPAAFGMFSVEERDPARADVTLSTAELRHLPLERTFALFRLAPGHVETIGGDTILGAYDSGNAFSIDGVQIDDATLTGISLPFDFFDEVNVLTIAAPVEFGHATGGHVLASTLDHETRLRVFAFYTPRVTDTHGFDSSSTRLWDAGFTAGTPLLNKRLWLFGAYDRQRIDYDRNGIVTNRFTISLNELVAKAELQATPRVTVIAEALGDPGRLASRYQNEPTRYDIGNKAGSLRAFANAGAWLLELAVSHASVDSGYDTSSNRVSGDVQRMAGAHLFRAGVDLERASASIASFAGDLTDEHARTSALYVGDSWDVSPTLTVNAGLRRGRLREDSYRYANDVWLPRAAIAWQSPVEAMRLFATWGRYADDVALALADFPQRVDEATAGVSYQQYGMNASARLIHRKIELLPFGNFINGVRRTVNGALFAVASGVRDLHFRASYLYSSTHDAAPFQFDSTARRPHQLTASWTDVAGPFEGGVIATWVSSAALPETHDRAPSLFRTDLHAGYSIHRVTLVADVFNLLNRRTPYGFSSEFVRPPGFPQLDEPVAWLAPRSIRFGVRAAL